MSVKELRINKMRFAKEENYGDYQIFSIGSETCIIKFFKLVENQKLQEFLKNRKEEGKQIKIITPFVPERHLEKMKKTLKGMLESDLYRDSVIVVNDLGMMRYIHSISQDTKISIGRIMLYSMDTVPWGELLFESESEDVKKVVHQISFYDDIKMDFYRKFHVTEIEVSLTKGCVDSLKAIQEQGFKVNVHTRDVLYGTQRSCYIRRNGDFNCEGSECEQLEELKLSKLWSAAGPFSPEKEIPFPDAIYLAGNKIVGTLEELDSSWSDAVIYDLAREDFFKEMK